MNKIRDTVAFQDGERCFNVCPVDIAEARYACTAAQTTTCQSEHQNTVL